MSKYFYIISIFWQAVGSTVPHEATCTGIVDVANGETQETVYQTLFARTCEQFGAPPRTTAVRNYYLARNGL